MARTQSQSGSKWKRVASAMSAPRDASVKTINLKWEKADNECTLLSGKDSTLGVVELYYDSGTLPLKYNGTSAKYIPDSTSVLHDGTNDGGVGGFSDALFDSRYTLQYFPLEGEIGYTSRNSGQSTYAATYKNGNSSSGFQIVASSTVASAMSAYYYLADFPTVDFSPGTISSPSGYIDTGHLNRIFGRIADDGIFEFKIPIKKGEAIPQDAYLSSLRSSTLIDGNHYTRESTIGGFAYAIVSGISGAVGTHAMRPYGVPASAIFAVVEERNLNRIGASYEMTDDTWFKRSYYKLASVEEDGLGNSAQFFDAVDAIHRRDYSDFLWRLITSPEGDTIQSRDLFRIVLNPYCEKDRYRNFAAGFAWTDIYPATSGKLVMSGSRTFHNGPFLFSNLDGGQNQYPYANGFLFSSADTNSVFAFANGKGYRVAKTLEDFDDNTYMINQEEGETTILSSYSETVVPYGGVVITMEAKPKDRYKDIYPNEYKYVVEKTPYGCVATLQSKSPLTNATQYIPAFCDISAWLDEGSSAKLLTDSDYDIYGGGTSTDALKVYKNGNFVDVKAARRKLVVVSGGESGESHTLHLAPSLQWLDNELSSVYLFTVEPSEVTVNSVTDGALISDTDDTIKVFDEYGNEITTNVILDKNYFFLGNLKFAVGGEESPIASRDELRLKFGGPYAQSDTKIYSTTPYTEKTDGYVELIYRDDFIPTTTTSFDGIHFGDNESFNIIGVATNSPTVTAQYVVSIAGNSFVYETELSSVGRIPTLTDTEETTAFGIDGSRIDEHFVWQPGVQDYGAYARFSISAEKSIKDMPYFSKMDASLKANLAYLSASESDDSVWWDFVCNKGDNDLSLNLCNASSNYSPTNPPKTHELEFMVYYGYGGGNRGETSLYTQPSAVRVPDVLVGKGADLNTTGEYSNPRSSANPVIYGDMSSASNLHGSIHYTEDQNYHTITADRAEFVNGEIAPGTSGSIYLIASANGNDDNNRFIVYGKGTAWNIPEVDYIRDGLELSAYPEYTYNDANSSWYHNGYLNVPKTEYTFGSAWNFGTVRISDGVHSENMYYRIILPDAFNDHEIYSGTKVELTYTTSSDTSPQGDTTEYIGQQIGKCLTAVQYVDIPPRNVGKTYRVNKKATVHFDVSRKRGDEEYFVFENASKEYYDSQGNPHPRLFTLYTDYYPNATPSDKQYRFGPSFIPTQEFINPYEGGEGNLIFYYPVDGLVGDTVYDKRYALSGDEYIELSGDGLSSVMVFPGNVIGVAHGGMTVRPPLSIKGTEVVEAYLSAVASGNEASASFDNPGSILWNYHTMAYNTGFICELHPAYEWEEQLGVVRDHTINVLVSAQKSYGVAIRADVAANHSWNGIPSLCMDWDSFGATVSGTTSGYLRALPEIKFVSPIVVVNRNTAGYVPWYNESDTEKYDFFAVQGTNASAAEIFPKEDTVYRMSGFKDAGYYGIEASGYLTVTEVDPNVTVSGLPVIRKKQVFDKYASNRDIYVETYESWSSAVLRTPLSDDISLDYTMTDLAIGPNELMTNDVINRRFEMLQHDLDQVKAISKYYHNPPTKFVGYVGYGSDTYASADYSMDTYISLRDHFGFWNSGDDSMQNRLDWQWCRSSSGEFVCPSAKNLASATIVSGATSMDIDDNTMNIYATIGSKFRLGGMSSYTQVYETSGHVIKDRDYAEVNATEPRITSIKVMDNGRVFMLAPDFNRVLCYSRFDDMNARTPYDLVFMYDFGGLGGGDSNLRFNNPIALALDNGLHENLGQLVYVLDEGNQCVKAFNSYGAFVSMIPYELKKYMKEAAVSLAVGVDGTICVLTTHRVLYYSLEGEKKGEYKLSRLNPIQLCNNKNSNFLYVVYDDDIVKVSTGGLFVGNFSVSQVWHRIGGWKVHEIPPFYGKIRFMAVTKYDQIYLALDNIILIYADLLREMALAGNTYDQYSWSLEDIKIGKQEYMQDFVVNAALHRMYDNIDLFKRSIYARIRVREKNGIKYIKTDNVMASEYAYLQDMPTKDEVFIPSNAPMSARVFNDNIKLLYEMIVKLLNWCQV